MAYESSSNKTIVGYDVERILFFDGECVMCNGLVDFALRHDTQKLFKFAPLQGETARKLLKEDIRKSLSTVVLLEGTNTYTRSDAIIRFLSSLGGFYRLFYVLKIIPKFLRDFVYKIIAKNRYIWFGKKEACRMPTKEERGRILD